MTDQELAIAKELIAYLCKGDRLASGAGTLTLRAEGVGDTVVVSADDGVKVEHYLLSIGVRQL